MIIEKTQIYLTIISLMIGSIFQNCSNHNFKLVDSSPRVLLPIDHPSFPEVESSPSAELALIDQKGILTMLEEVFLSDDISEDGHIQFSRIFSSQIKNQQHMFGRPCDILATGDFADCANNFTNLSIGMSQSSSTIRSATLIQTCRSLVSQNELMQQLMIRLEVQNSNGPERIQALRSAIHLFYPAWENIDPILQSLQNVDSQMEKNGEGNQKRWMTIINILCESPYWGLL